MCFADAAELEKKLKISKVALVNDFFASGYGLLTLGRQDVCIFLQAHRRYIGVTESMSTSSTSIWADTNAQVGWKVH